MDKTKVKSIQAPYSPPLSPTQIDEISRRIDSLSELERAEAMEKSQRPCLLNTRNLRRLNQLVGNRVNHSHFVAGSKLDELLKPK